MSLVLLKPILDALKTQYPGRSDGDLFEIYCANNVLVTYHLDEDEISEGIVDGSRDAGIDSAYVLVNRVLLTDDYPFESIKHQVDIELVIIQSKIDTTFKEGPIDRLSSSLPLLLDPGSKVATLEKAFKKTVVGITQSFLQAINKLGTQFPKVYVRVFYCCKGSAPNDTIRAKAAALEGTLRKLHPNASITFLGAPELYQRSSLQRRLVKQLPIFGSPLSSKNGYVALCRLKDYIKFVRDDENKLITRIFEANVRAYQGENDVNKDIGKTLEPPTSGVDFWWLNNGVTIVADMAQFQDQKLTIENPLVVNGLQTSFELDEYAVKLADNDERMLLVRVIEETDRAKRDQIIKATNRQTAITASSFRATEPIQRQIEDYLKTLNFYYDRRKNLYKREGKPADRIITIDRLAQGVLAVVLKEPHVARARPTAAFKSDELYGKIFSPDHPIQVYGVVAELLYRINVYFRSIKNDVPQDVRNNMKFHSLMVLSWALNGHTTLPVQAAAKLDVSKATTAQIKAVCGWVFKLFESEDGEDRTAKGENFTKKLTKEWTKTKTKPKAGT